MMKRVAIAAGLLVAAAAATPALAQANDSKLIVFGNDPCPAGSVCVRAPESERYRIPKTLRRTEPSPDNETWRSRQASVTGAGASGIGSCSATGPGGYIGCWQQEMKAAKQERKAEKENGAPPQ